MIIHIYGKSTKGYYTIVTVLLYYYTSIEEQFFGLYLFRQWMRAPSLSLLHLVFGCSSEWLCACEHVFLLSESECMYLQPSLLICALQ